MLKREYWTFWRIFWIWMAIVFVAALLDAWLLHAPWYFSSLVRSGLGITLLFYPVYPPAFEWASKNKKAWSPEKCRRVIRVVAVLEILLCFCVHIAAE